MKKKVLLILGAVVLILIIVASFAGNGNLQTSTPSTLSMPFGDYTVKKTAAGADSIENLAQMDDCIQRSDKSCETAMLLDGRASLVEAGTLITGGETQESIFCGTVRSGALVGKEVCLPIGAFK
jgi:hypothetical protein